MEQALGLIIIAVGSIAALGYFPLQAYALKVLGGRRRCVAFVPLCGMIPVLVVTMAALVQGSNLWPLLLLFTAPFAALFLVLLLVVHAVQGRSRP